MLRLQSAVCSEQLFHLRIVTRCSIRDWLLRIAAHALPYQLIALPDLNVIRVGAQRAFELAERAVGIAKLGECEAERVHIASVAGLFADRARPALCR